jgi:hypothetical protein
MFTEVNFIFLNVKLNVKYSYEWFLLEAISSGVPPVVFTGKVYIVLEWAVSNEFIPK